MNGKVRKNIIYAIIGLGILLVGILCYNSLFVVTEMNQAVVTQFGEITDIAQKPGLQWKTPFIEKVNYFDKRLLEWDGEAKQIPTRGKKFITVDSWARWRIIDPRTFYESVTTETQGQAVLDDRIESALRDEISSLVLEETVRSTNRELSYVTEEIEDAQDVKTNIEVGRSDLMERVKKTASEKLREKYGIKLVDVQVKRINYIQDVRKDVYRRMRSERQRIAEKYLSEARSTKNEILGKMQKQLDTIESEGYRKAQTIKGKADAKAAEIYAEAYSRDPAFFEFMRTLESYGNVLDEQTFLLLTTETEYFELLEGDLPSDSPGEAQSD